MLRHKVTTFISFGLGEGHCDLLVCKGKDSYGHLSFGLRSS